MFKKVLFFSVNWLMQNSKAGFKSKLCFKKIGFF